MSLKTVLRSKKNAAHVAWSARALAERAGAILKSKLEVLVGEGEVLPDLVFFQELLGRYLDLRSRQLAEVDGRYSEDRRQGRALRQERQRQMTKVRGVLRDARYLLDRQLGRETSAVHLKDRNFTRPDAGGLVQLAREAATALRDPKVAWQPATLEGVGAGSAELAEALEREAQALEKVSQDQEGLQSRQQQAGLEEKTAELEKAKVAIRGGANLLAGLYTFADLPFHAQRVRQRVRKGGQAEEEGGGEETPPAGSKKEEGVPERD